MKVLWYGFYMETLSAVGRLYKERAILLRKEGKSYREILVEIPVAKSTLALWLQSVGLSQKQKQRLTEKRLASAYRGSQARRTHRIWETQQIMDAAQAEIGTLSWREFWLAGVMLYWAEGAKEKEYRPDARIKFTNTDPQMLKMFLKWLELMCGVPRENMIFEIYLHETHKHRLAECKEFWARETGFPLECFSRVYFKRAHIKTNRKNIGSTYFGVLTVRVTSSSWLSRRIAGWVKGVVESSR
jgi:hypothetical protein